MNLSIFEFTIQKLREYQSLKMNHKDQVSGSRRPALFISSSQQTVLIVAVILTRCCQEDTGSGQLKTLILDTIM